LQCRYAAPYIMTLSVFDFKLWQERSDEILTPAGNTLFVSKGRPPTGR